MVVATGVNDTLELASPRRRGSSSSDVVPEDDGIEQSAAGTTAMEDSEPSLAHLGRHEVARPPVQEQVAEVRRGPQAVLPRRRRGPPPPVIITLTFT